MFDGDTCVFLLLCFWWEIQAKALNFKGSFVDLKSDSVWILDVL